MINLRIEVVDGEAAIRDWQYVHNEIIPTDVLSLDDVRERSVRNRLEIAYLDGVPVGNSTVRPPADESLAATVIARVLPAHRRQGFGEQLYLRGLAHARQRGAQVIETVILASNVEGVRFAQAHGFVEVEQYVLPGGTIPYLTLQLS